MPTSGHDRLAFLLVPAKAAAPVAAAARLDSESLQLLRPEQTPREFLEALLQQQQYRDALRFLAFALPAREAIWWACLGTLWLQAGHLHKRDALALTAAVRWVLDPNETHRQDAEAQRNEQTAAGLVARAVAWTGGSVRPPSLPALPPGPDFPNRGVFLAMLRAVTAGPSDKLVERFRQAIALGMHIARGQFLWTQPSHKTTASPRSLGS